MKIHARININNTLNNYRDRCDITPSFYIFPLDLSVSTFGKNELFLSYETFIYINGFILMDNARRLLSSFFLEHIFLFGKRGKKGIRLFLKRPWDIINLFHGLLLELEIICTLIGKWSSGEEKERKISSLREYDWTQQKRYIKGKFSFRVPLDAPLWRFTVVIAFEISSGAGRREGGWGKKRRQGTKGRMDEIAKHSEGSVIE